MRAKLLAAMLLLGSPAIAQVVPSPVMTLHPCRVYDSRDTGILENGTTIYAQVRGKCNIPVEANAIVATMTMTGATGPGWVWIWESTLPTPAAGTNHFQGQGVTNSTLVLVRLSYPPGEDQNDIAIRPAFASTHVILDVVGYSTAPSN